MTISKRMILLVLAALVSVGVIAGVGDYQLTRVYTSASYGAVNSVPSYQLLGEISQRFADLRAQTLRHLIMTDEAGKVEMERAVNESRAKLDEGMRKYVTTGCAGTTCISDPAEQGTFDNLRSTIIAWDAPRLKTLELSKLNKTKDATIEMITQLAPAVQKVQDALRIEFDYNAELAKRGMTAGASAKSFANTMTILIALLAFAALSLLGFFIVRSITRPINILVQGSKKLAAGEFDFDLNLHSNDELGVLANGIVSLQTAVQVMTADTNTLAKAAVAGKLATRADASKHEGDFRKIVQGVNDTLDAVIAPLSIAADYVDKISKGNIPAKITDSYNGDFNTIKNNINQCIDGLAGLVEANEVLQRMALNDYTRPVAGKYAGLFAEVGTAVNDVQARIKHVTGVVVRVSNGDLSDVASLKGLGDGTGKRSEQDQLAPGLIRMIDAIGNLVNDADMLSKTALEGKLAARADVSKHQGDYRKVIKGVNETLDAVIGPLNVAADYVDKISRGNIPQKITDAYNGDFNTLKNNLNQCIDAINSLVADADTLVKAAVEGKLATRADATKHEGDFRKIVDGVNKTLDAVIAPVMEATGALELLARYDLRARMNGAYQGDHSRIKEALNGTAKALQDALSQVADAVEQVSEASQQIAGSSQAVSQGASEQASSLEETSSSLEQMAGMTKQNADNTIQARSLAQTTKEAAEKGGTAMIRMTDAMEKIRAASQGTADIIKDINEIAFQTNLLALNAAVEAARAGDAGRGFAVVAEEVRNLALRSKEAAKKTEDLIKVAVGHAENGRVITNEVAGSLTEIVTAAAKVNDIVSEIAVASQEQSRGIDQVNIAVAEMDKVVQTAAANAEESSSAAEELASQSEELSSLVQRFELDRDNRTAARRHAPTVKEASATRRTALHPATIPPPRRGAVNVSRGAVKKPSGANGNNGSVRKPSPEELIPLETDPEFQDF